MWLRTWRRQAAVQKSAEELRKQQEKDAAERAQYLAGRVPQLNIDGLDQCEQLPRFVSRHLIILKTVYSLHSSVALANRYNSETQAG